MSRLRVGRRWLRCSAGMVLVLLAGCAALPGTQSRKPINTFVLSAGKSVPGAPQAVARGPVISVALPLARAGYGGPRIAYTERPYEIRYYALNQWVDPPPAMLWPLLVRALENSGHFASVVTPASAASVDLRLNTEILALRQEFNGSTSRGRVVLRAQLTDLHSGRVLGTRVFDDAEPAPGNDPYGGVVAINRALARVLPELVRFCSQASGPRR